MDSPLLRALSNRESLLITVLSGAGQVEMSVPRCRQKPRIAPLLRRPVSFADVRQSKHEEGGRAHHESSFRTALLGVLGGRECWEVSPAVDVQRRAFCAQRGERAERDVGADDGESKVAVAEYGGRRDGLDKVNQGGAISKTQPVVTRQARARRRREVL